jgi:hypothetical protein
MTPQVQTLLNHLRNHGSISQAEAGLLYRIRALPRRISDLKELGHKIVRQLKTDATGQRYARYSLIKTGAKIRIVNPWMPIGYQKDSEGVVTYVYQDLTGVEAQFPGSPGTVYVSSTEFEVIQ